MLTEKSLACRDNAHKYCAGSFSFRGRSEMYDCLCECHHNDNASMKRARCPACGVILIQDKTPVGAARSHTIRESTDGQMIVVCNEGERIR